MPDSTSTRRTKPAEDLRVALVHYTAPPVVGGVEGVMAMQKQLIGSHAVAAGEPLVLARRGEDCDILVGHDPLDELRHKLRGCSAVIVHNVLTMPFDLPLTEALWQLAEEMPDVRWIAWIHDLAACNPDYDRPWHQAPWNRLAQASPHFTYVAVSEHRARQFHALTGAKARVIPNGVDARYALGLHENRWRFVEQHDLLRREMVFIQPARLVRRKNIERGLEVVAELRGRGRDAMTLITAADDPHNAAGKAYGKELRTLRRKLGLEKAALFVADHLDVDGDTMAALYTLSDALFFPSKQEGFGLPLLEAALHRLALFCTDVEPINRLLEKGVHVFAPDASVPEIATLIERTLDRSPAHRARREALRRYSWSSIWHEHLAPLLGRR